MDYLLLKKNPFTILTQTVQKWKNKKLENLKKISQSLMKIIKILKKLIFNKIQKKEFSLQTLIVKLELPLILLSKALS
jgi:hypothetical protein